MMLNYRFEIRTKKYDEVQFTNYRECNTLLDAMSYFSSAYNAPDPLTQKFALYVFYNNQRYLVAGCEPSGLWVVYPFIFEPDMKDFLLALI